ncbi:MAG: trimethylamine methyltransferase family protein [Spirochaetia bacterium]
MKLNKMEVLSRSEIKMIREGSAGILEDTGVKIHSPEILELLKKKGAVIDAGSGTARFPGKLQEQCLSTVPGKITVRGREGNPVLELGGEHVYFASGHNAVFMEKPLTKVYRELTRQDVSDFAHLAEQLDDIDMLGLPGAVSDAASGDPLLNTLAISMAKSVKPVFFSTDSAEVNRAAMNMTEIITGKTSPEHYYMISQFSPTSPLQWEDGAVRGTAECAKRGFPVAILLEPITGVSAPYTLAGLITIHNAEALSGIIITQLINPGTPVIWASSWTAFDMKEGTALVGSAETSLARIAGAQLARSYGIPVHTTAPNSDNHVHDEQNAWEKTISALTAAAAGNQLIVNCGMYACGMTVSLEQLVMDAEIAGQVKRICRGIEVSETAVAADLIKEKGQSPDYITDDHTLNLLHSEEHRNPLVAQRGGRQSWINRGAPDSVREARGIADALLAKKGPELSGTLRQRIEDAVI